MERLAWYAAHLGIIILLVITVATIGILCERYFPENAVSNAGKDKTLYTFTANGIEIAVRGQEWQKGLHYHGAKEGQINFEEWYF